ncbi:MAG TPA: DinB family protein [Acidimicrobiia bacterium]|nr:DinB family protein [Acidimicrobiia bacterium]
MSSTLVHLFRHNRWANRLMMEACRGLSDEQLDTTVNGTYGTIRDTITHLVRAESGYAFRLIGGDRIFGREEPFPGVDRSIEVLEQTGAALEKVAADLDPKRIIEIVTDEATTQIPGFVILLQAVNHATDHRSHIATILTQLGHEPPELDLWSYNEAGLSRA